MATQLFQFSENPIDIAITKTELKGSTLRIDFKSW